MARTQLNDAQLQGANTVTIQSGTTYTVPTTTETVILTNTAARTLTLPAAADHVIGRITVIDGAGTAESAPITVNPDGSDTILGDASLTLAADNGGITLVSDRVSAWYVV